MYNMRRSDIMRNISNELVTKWKNTSLIIEDLTFNLLGTANCLENLNFNLVEHEDLKEISTKIEYCNTKLKNNKVFIKGFLKLNSSGIELKLIDIKENYSNMKVFNEVIENRTKSDNNILFNLSKIEHKFVLLNNNLKTDDLVYIFGFKNLKQKLSINSNQQDLLNVKENRRQSSSYNPSYSVYYLNQQSSVVNKTGLFKIFYDFSSKLFLYFD